MDFLNTSVAAEKILSALVSPEVLEDLAIDAVPRPAEGLVYNAGVHISTLLERIAAAMIPLFHADDALLVLLVTIKDRIDAVLVPPAGSALLRLIPGIISLVAAYLKANPATSFSAASKAVQAHVEASESVEPMEAISAPAAPPTVESGGMA